MKALVSFFVIVSMLVSFVMPAYALGSFTVEYTTRGKKYIMSDGTINGTYTGDDGSSITWTLTPKGTLTVSGSGCLPHIWLDPDNKPIAERIKTVTINSGITALDNCTFSQCSNMTTVSLPSSVTSIGFAAFASCPKLASIIIPSNITYIGEYAFYSCTALQSIALPSTVTMIDTEAFANCTALTSATVYGDIGTNAFNNCTALASLSLGGYPEYIGDGAFAYCESLTSVDIPSSVLEVGVGAFAYCEKMTSAIASGNLGESAFDCCYALKDVELGEYCTTIGRRCFSDCKALENITIPENVTEICDAAFQNCSSLKAINIPESVESLEDHAFYGCKELVQVNLLADLVAIEQCLFAYCEKLESIELPSTIKSIEGGAFGYCSSMTSIDIPAGCKTIAEKAFFGCQKLQSISVPNTLNSIGEAVFYECKELQGITIPQGIKAIPDHAFAFCESLSVVSLPAGLINIGNYAFTSCKKLDDVTLPSSIEEIGEYAFYECEAINSISVPQKVTVIPEGTFAMCSALKSIALPTTLTEIDKAAFIKCEALESIEIPDAVNYLGLAAFAGCKKLGSIALPAGITEILDSTFLDCTSLKNISIAGNIISIGDYSFASCESLEGIALPASVTHIGKQAFSFCEKLTTVNLPSNLKKIGEAAFLDCAALKKLALGSSVQEIGDDAFAACTSLTNLTLDSGNKSFVIVSNVLYDVNKTRLISLVPADNPVSISIPNTVTDMGEMTFYRCDNIESVTLPLGIKEIGSLMFYECPDLKSVVIPDGITRIGEYAFSGCEKLRDVNIPGSVQTIGEGAFNDCMSLRAIEIPSGVSTVSFGSFFGCCSLKDISLPSTVTQIEDYAFAQCDALDSVQLPQTLSEIGEYAFAGCDNLSGMNLPESLTNIGEGAFAECSALTSISLPSEINWISDFLFYDCPSLESVDLHGDVFAIGVGSFSSSPALSKVVFAGNAPEVIGDRAFEKVSDDLVLHYEQAATGWTTPEWTGPDETVYNTSTVYSGTCGEKLEWNLVTATGELTVWGSGEMYDWDSEKLPPWQPYMDLIRRVRLEEGVTSVGASAFSGAPELVSVSIPSSMAKAGYAAFATCLKLNTVECSGGLKAISECMFYNDDQLWNVEFADGITDIPSYAFYGCCNLGDIVIPGSVKTIGEGSFAACVSIEELTLRGVIDEIGSGAFFDCAGLSSIVVESGKPKKVGNYAFYGCNSDLTVTGLDDSSWLLTEDEVRISTVSSADYSGTIGSINWSISLLNRQLHISGSGEIPDFDQGGAPWLKYADLVYELTVDEGITRIGSFAFTEMDYINVISLPSSLKTIGNYSMSKCTSLRSISLPDNLQSIGEGAFACCISLIDVTLPGRISVIPDYAFSECYQLSRISANTEISSVGYGAFYSCLNLETVDFLYGIDTIGAWSFAFCEALKTGISDAKHIGEYAFYCCNNLTSVDLTGTSSLSEYAFSQSGVETISIPGTIREIPECCFELCKKLRSLSIESGVKSISKDAFYGCLALTDVNLGQIETLGDFAFMASGLRAITLPNTVLSCGIGAFCDCVNLTTIESDNRYKSIEGVLFFGDELIQYPGGKSERSYIIPEFVTAIADYAFYGSINMADIVVGNDVTEIGFAAFASCNVLNTVTLGKKITSLSDAIFEDDTNLASVTFLGNSPASIGENAFYSIQDSVVLRYAEGRMGWTDGIWTGPDGNLYNTEAVASVVSVTMDNDEDGLLVTVDNCGLESKEIAVVYSISSNDRIVATKTCVGNYNGGSKHTFLVNTYSCLESQTMALEAFALDANSGAPLTKSHKVTDISSIVANNNYIDVIERDLSDENTLVSRAFVQDAVPVVATEINDTILISRSFPDIGDPGALQALSIQAQAEYLANNPSYIPGDDTVKLRFVDLINIDPYSHEESVAVYGNYKEGNAMHYVHTSVAYANTIIDGDGNYVIPSTYIRGAFNSGALKAEKAKTLASRAHLKFEVGSEVELDSVNTSIDVGIDKGIMCNYEFEANKVKTGLFMRARDEGETDSILEISGSYGKGFYYDFNPLSIKRGGLTAAVKEFSTHRIKIGVDLTSADHKQKASLEFVFDNDALGQYIEKHMPEFKLIQYIDALMIEVMNSSHEVDRRVFVSIVRDAENNIKDARIIPTTSSKYIPGDQMYNKALPKSSGGTVMPTDSTQKTGGGIVNSEGKVTKLTQGQKDEIYRNIFYAMVSNKISQKTAKKLFDNVENLGYTENRHLVIIEKGSYNPASGGFTLTAGLTAYEYTFGLNNGTTLRFIDGYPDNYPL